MRQPLPRHAHRESLARLPRRFCPARGSPREHAAIAALVAQQLSLGVMALMFGAVLFDRGPHVGRPTTLEIAQAVLGVVLVVVFSNQVIPWLLFERTEGLWAARLMWPIRLLLWSMTPITVVIRFFFSIAALAEEPVTAEEEAAVDVEALLEAGEEEGIIAEEDRDLVRSAVEFGDKLVREVMTPRPQVFAVRDATTLEQFLTLLRDHNYSRVPVYADCWITSRGLRLRTICCRLPMWRRGPARWRAFSGRRRLCRRPSAAMSCCARCSARSSTCAS